jgi:hypothetical protein
MAFKYLTKVQDLPHIHDVRRIHKVLASRGHWVTLDMCHQMWDNYSDSMCAGWIILPEDDETIYNILVEE